ncbi:MAG: GNAT family N-acetyltransferase [Pseudomonadota bacterium]
MSYSIRRYRDSDAEALSALSLAAIRVVGSHGYSDAQVAAWAGRHGGPEMYRNRAAQGHLIFVAVDQSDEPVAYALLEPDGHLDRLYCHPDHTRNGLAERLLDTAEEEARAFGLTRLYTEASELARPAFERAGYGVTHRRDFTIEHDGRAVAIHNFAMEKRLD